MREQGKIEKTWTGPLSSRMPFGISITCQILNRHGKVQAKDAHHVQGGWVMAICPEPWNTLKGHDVH